MNMFVETGPVTRCRRGRGSNRWLTAQSGPTHPDFSQKVLLPRPHLDTPLRLRARKRAAEFLEIFFFFLFRTRAVKTLKISSCRPARSSRQTSPPSQWAPLACTGVVNILITSKLSWLNFKHVWRSRTTVNHSHLSPTASIFVSNTAGHLYLHLHNVR